MLYPFELRALRKHCERVLSIILHLRALPPRRAIPDLQPAAWFQIRQDDKGMPRDHASGTLRA